MLKYAKIINEETKQCFVGLNDLDDIYCDEIAYDEDGNPYELKMTYKEYYESIGMSKMEVEQAVCGQWYLQGYAPEPTPLTHEEVRQMRIEYRRNHIDDQTSERSRKQANGTWTDDDEIAYLALDTEVTAYIEENLPYPEENE